MRGLVTKITTGAMVAGMLVGPAGLASAESSHGMRRVARAQVVRVTSDATHSRAHFSNTWVHEGRISFRISTTNSHGLNVTLFRLHHGVSFARLRADLKEEFSRDGAAKGTRDLTRDVTFYGLAQVVKGAPATATVNLEEGIYYAFDVGSEVPPTSSSVTRLHVTEGGDETSRLSGVGYHNAAVSVTSKDRFVVSGRLRAHGSVLLRNVSDTLHFMSINPVKPGTTDKQVQAYFDSHAQTPPPFGIEGLSVGTDVLSPGKRLLLRYSLPKGTYVLLCFVSDDKTGMPHAFMGMHKVVTLR